MPYDRELADMIRASLAHLPAVREVTMFGGLSFLVNEKLTVSAGADGGLLIRVDPSRVGELLEHQDAKPAEMGRRKMSKGWLRIGSEGIKTEAALDYWIRAALEYNAEQTA